MWYEWKPYVSVAERRRNAAREVAKLVKKGRAVSPVAIEGRTIARTFWGVSWCKNLERYSDYASRLPRGRSYVRNGSVVDLDIAPAQVNALVSGTELYRVAIKVSPLPRARWSSICKDCGGAIDSLVELLQGRFSDAVMDRICREKTGLFPAPAEIELDCSCPDWATMCKHVAAVLYGIGARLDERPELLFKLRKVDEKDLIAQASSALPLSRSAPAADKILAADGLSELFGLDLGGAAEPTPVPTAPRPRRAMPEPGAHRKAKPAPDANAKARPAPDANLRARTAPAASAKARTAPNANAKARPDPDANAKARTAPAANAKARTAPAANAKARTAPAASAKARTAPDANAKARTAPERGAKRPRPASR
jgi:uncharacterized Zn finger protein